MKEGYSHRFEYLLERFTRGTYGEGKSSGAYAQAPLPTSANYCTTSAVTMPNMPCADSACVRIWQWKAHAPAV